MFHSCELQALLCVVSERMQGLVGNFLIAQTVLVVHFLFMLHPTAQECHQGSQSPNL